MTKEQIQALIDAKIAGQGSAVDVGGALPAILSEILNLASASPANMPKPLVLERVFSDDDTLESLAQSGLTDEEIQAAARGERTCVVIDSVYYNITTASFESSDVWSFAFESHVYDSNGSFLTMVACSAENAEGELTIKHYEV